jgi:DNA-binding CsgD family transcriptional regulator
MELGAVLREAMLWEKKFPVIADISSNRLSTREVEILRMAAMEHSSGEIATKLFITLRTVESHRKRIMRKTGSKNIVGAVLFAIKNNYFSLEEI